MQELHIICAQNPFCNPTDTCCQVFHRGSNIFALDEELTSDGAAHRFSLTVNGTGMWKDAERLDADPPAYQTGSARCNLAWHPADRHRGARPKLIHFPLVKMRTHKTEGANVNLQKGVFCEYMQ